MSNSQLDTERREVMYSGHVQGVGFRYTTQRIASHYSVTGYVRNLANGRVELVVEGEKDQLDRLLADIDDRLGQYVVNRTVDCGPATGQFHNFTIRF